MTPFEWAGWLICGALGIVLLIQFENTRTFTSPRLRERHSWPTLSVLIPARNEERSIRDCVGSLGQQDYGGELEIIVLDDGSDDDTAAVVEQIGLAHPDVRLLRGSDLPDGGRRNDWATEQLGHAASGDYLLFTSADTIHDRDAAATVIAHAEENETDLLSLEPRQILGSVGEALVVPLLRFFHLTLRFVLTPFEGSRFHTANGPFVLFRRSAWDATRGHSVAGSHADDLDRVPEERPRIEILDGRFLVRCRMYRSWHEVVEGFTENLDPRLKRSAARASGIAMLLVTLFVVPPVSAVLTGSFSWIMATILGLFLRLRTGARSGEPITLTLLHPVAIMVAAVLLVRSALISRAGSTAGRSCEQNK